MLITSSFFDHEKYKGQKYSIALSQPKGMNFLTLNYLLPTWDMVKDYRKSKITWEQYTKKYFKILDKNKEKLKDLFEQSKSSTIVLLCWEKAGDNCHRNLVLEYIQTKIMN